jgi:hypothetical protein
MESDFSMLVKILNSVLVLIVIFSAGFLLTGIATELSASAISRTAAQNWQQGWVDQEADIQASRGRMGHYQQCPSGYRAGVGMSTRGPEDAIRRCCYWNSRLNVRWFSVRRSGNAWYAAALYRN